MIPKVNLGAGELEFIFRNLHISLKITLSQGYRFEEFALFFMLLLSSADFFFKNQKFPSGLL